MKDGVYSNWADQSIYGVPQGERLTMTEFALRYFRQPKSSDYGSFTLNRKKKDWTWQDVTDKVKFTEKPLTHSLLKLESSEFDKTAVDLFDCVMRYMGDMHKKRGQTITDCVYEILSACHKNQVLADEVYCQIIKQTTCNKSPKADSLLLGWRLFTIITAYFAPSTSLQPYLIKYLNDIANDPRRPFNGTANLCLINLQQTLKYGGRKFILTAAEVEAITSGKNVKRQAYEFPGDQKKLISTRTITVAEEIIKDMCNEMNVWSEIEQAEFALCYILDRDSSLRVLSNNEYILDITSELETRNEKFTLILTRTVWIHPLREDNQLYIDVLFFQVMPNYMAGLLTPLPIGSKAQLPAKTLDDAAKLAAYLHLASGNAADSLTDEAVQTLIPRTVLDRAQLSPSNWVGRISQKLAAISTNTNGNLARLEFLKIIQNWPLYGSSFYFVAKCQLAEKTYEGPVVAVNKTGLSILSPANLDVQLNCPLSTIRSSRKYNNANGSFLDIHLGPENDPEAAILTIATDLGSEIARVIGQYVYLSSHKAQTIFNTRNVRQA
uniref:MyTH4 domain-containing protein n=1 Tax=Panagrellus redivivus TaxID=6233 RepID=A0A7E4VLF9_PANRE